MRRVDGGTGARRAGGGRAVRAGSPPRAERAGARDRARRIVVFRAGAERFAVDAASVDAVVDDVRPTPLPGFADHVVGTLRYRGQWALALDVGVALGVAGAERGSAAVVVRGPGLRYALVADAIPASRSVEADRLEPSDAGGAAEPDADRFPVFLDAEGPVTYVDPVALFRIAVPDGWEERMTSSDASAAPRPVVAFRVGDQQFGLDVSQVHEVLRYEPPRAIPRAPAFVEGVLELRDTVIPVVDMRARFDLAADPPGDEARILVISLAAERVGLIVDGVSDVIQLPPEAVSPPPEYFRGLAEEYLDGLARLDDRILILLRVDRVLTEEQTLALLGVDPVDEPVDDAGGDEASDPAAGSKKAGAREKSKPKAKKKTRSTSRRTGGGKGGGRSKS